MLICILLSMALPVSAMEFTAPTVPEDVEELMPAEQDTFAAGLWKVLTRAVGALQPKTAEAARLCVSLIAIAILTAMLRQLPGGSNHLVELVGCIAVACLLLSRTDTMIRLGSETVARISDYGRLLLPVLTGAMAAQGAVTSSAALYAGTAAFDAILSEGINRLLVPMVYMYLVLAIAACAVGDSLIGKLRDLIKGLLSWGLKLILYIFTGYMSITGVVSGPTDAAALKAAKLTISGVIPVVGGILSDASEAVLVGAGTVKNAIGLYGLFAVVAIWTEPFIKIGTHYLLLRFTGNICGIFVYHS